VVYAGGHGTGALGERVRTALRELEVAVLQPPASSGDTGVCLTFVDAHAERTFITAPGAEAVLTLAQLDTVAPAPADIVALSGYDLAYEDAGEALAAWVSSLPIGQPVLLDPGPLVAEIPSARWAAVISRVTVLTVNEREAELLAGGRTDDPPALHRWIRERHPMDPAALVVIRLGADGCTYDGGPDRSPVTAVPSIPVTALDTTGAGDTHTGVLLAELAAGTGIREALQRANVAAALSVTRSGPASAPTRGEVDTAGSDFG
jgi:sugar/nucleoside kinase (ribokinase family)